MVRRLRFSEVSTFVPESPGIYEIHMHDGVPLKVGIAGNLRRRLAQHGASKQSGLKGKGGSHSWRDPDDVQSKRSILAKHLYFDSTIAPSYDLRVETDRQRFLENECFITYQRTTSRDAAREVEKTHERSGRFRYTGKVVQR